jgi:hypothetical protein
LEDIADASAQFIPIHNQANRYKVVVKLIDDCIPFFSIGPTRIRADIDILNEAKVYVTGLLAHDEKLRGSIAVETLRDNFLPKKPPARKPPARKPPARKNNKKKELTPQELDDAANLLANFSSVQQPDIVVI